MVNQKESKLQVSYHEHLILGPKLDAWEVMQPNREPTANIFLNIIKLKK